MPSESTIELRHIKNTIGETTDLPTQSPLSSISSKLKALMMRLYGVPQLTHLFGAYNPNTSLTLQSGENQITAIVSDGIYLYVGLYTFPGKVIKIDLSTFTEISTVSFQTGLNYINCLFLDGTYLYAGLDTHPGNIVRIKLSTFTVLDYLTLPVGKNDVLELYSDGTYLYAGMNTSPGTIYKIDSSLTISETLTLDAGENQVHGLFIDGTYLYAGMNTSPGKLVKVDLSSFTKVSTLTLSTDENVIKTLCSDGTYLYAGLAPETGLIVKIDLSSLTKVSTLTLLATEGFINSLATDGTYLYSASYSNSGNIVIIDLSTFTKVTTFTTLGEPITTLYSDGIYLYAGTYANPGKVIRRYIIPTTSFHNRKIDLIDEQIHTGTYSVYPTLATGTELTSNVVAWTKGTYSEVIPVDTILSQYYITGVYLYNLTVNTEYEVDIATGASTSEIIKASVFNKVDNTDNQCLHVFPTPIKISSNTRISARCADETGGLACKIKIQYKT